MELAYRILSYVGGATVKAQLPKEMLIRSEVPEVMVSMEPLHCRWNTMIPFICIHSMGTPIVWLFWDYSPMPPHIRLSIETMKCHNYPDVHVAVVDDNFIKKEFDDLPYEFRYLIPAHKADYFRCRILLRYGGMWMDADTIQWDSVIQYFKYLKDFDVFGYTWIDEIIGITIIGPIRANSLLLQKWRQKADALLRRKRRQLAEYADGLDSYPIGWTGILRDIMQDVMAKYLRRRKIRYYQADGPELFGQLMINEIDLVLWDEITNETRDRIDKIPNSVPLLIYHNQQVPYSWLNHDLETFWSKDIVFNELIGQSFYRCKDRLRKRSPNTSHNAPFQDVTLLQIPIL